MLMEDESPTFWWLGQWEGQMGSWEPRKMWGASCSPSPWFRVFVLVLPKRKTKRVEAERNGWETEHRFWGKREGRRKEERMRENILCWRKWLLTDDIGWIEECGFCGNSLWLLLETEKVRQRVKQREGLFRASAWRGPLFILPFWAEGDRRVSHATRRHPAGQPRKGAIAAGKEGLAIGINYSEWRGLCLPFSPLF